MRSFAGLALLVGLSACGSEVEERARPAEPTAAGLVSLSCDGSQGLRPLFARYCSQGRNYMTPEARDALVDAASRLQARYPEAIVRFMDGSGPDGIVPFPPHLSHGDGRQVDLALYYTDTEGHPLADVPDTRNWGGYWPAEPPLPGERVACPEGRSGRAEKPDPPSDRPWRLDNGRTKALVEILIADDRVRRVFIEPHLEERFGLWGHSKVRFAGCQAARHDDHIHVDFF